MTERDQSQIAPAKCGKLVALANPIVPVLPDADCTDDLTGKQHSISDTGRAGGARKIKWQARDRSIPKVF